jgi:hypothetical protein
VEVADRELAALDEHGHEDPRPAREVLDVLVSAVLTRGSGARGLLRGGLGVLSLERAYQRILRVGRQRERRHGVGVGRDQLGLARVPVREEIVRGGGPDYPWVRDPGESHAGDVPRSRLLAVEVPDRLVGVGEVVGQEATAVVAREDAGVAPALPGDRPALLRHGSKLEDVDDEQIAGLGALDGDRAAQGMDDRHVEVADVLGRVVVVDRAVEPLAAVEAELGARSHRRHGRDVGVPAVVRRDFLVVERLRLVEAEEHLGHGSSLRVLGGSLSRSGEPGAQGVGWLGGARAWWRRTRGHDPRLVGAAVGCVTGAAKRRVWGGDRRRAVRTLGDSAASWAALVRRDRAHRPANLERPAALTSVVV